jgi:hypothetical protein
MFRGECRQDALFVASLARMRNVVEPLVELDCRLSRPVFEATQASRLYVQHLSHSCHVTGALA